MIVVECNQVMGCDVIELSSSQVPAAERFDWWRDLTIQSFLLTEISSDRIDDFHASATISQFGSVLLGAPEFDGMKSVRTEQLIRRSDPEFWMLTMVRSGSMWFKQGRSHAPLTAGDLMFHDTSRPFQSQALRHGGLARTITLHLPRKAIPLPDRLLCGQASRAFSARRGPAALLSQFMEQLLQQGSALEPADRARLETVAIDLSTVFLAAVTDTSRMVPAQTRQQTLVRQIKFFVQHHLTHSDLSPVSIAAAHHISVRYLHHLFQQEEETVGGYVRAQRLERCRTDLADGSQIGRSVAEIAARWGFADAAVFSRTFRLACGVPPGEYRRHATAT
ncbi:helix-turn-helix domain-containing protein [Streptosporangium saharense]|uniref:helix-turn-helix domain-containing protein n=1 Tax=Streptosporangium saharense TaxID=1706840 RepID=UPI00332DB843